MANLVIAIADPARRGGISWVAFLLQVLQACVLARGSLFQKIEGLLSGDRISNVGEVDDAHDLLRLHVREQFPERLTFNARIYVPVLVDESSSSKMNDAFFGRKPA